MLECLDFSIRSGTTGVLGPNGAGKTTFLRSLAGLERRYRGSVELGRLDIKTAQGIKTVRSELGYLGQAGEPFPSLTVSQSVEYAAWLKGLSGQVLHDQIEWVKGLTNLSEIWSNRASRLSGGEFRRLCIAQAIVHRPAVLLLDEPTASLDPFQRRSLLNVLIALKEEMNIIFTSHDTRELVDVADRVIVFDRAKCVFSDTLAQFEALAPISKANESSRLEEAYNTLVG